MPWSIRQPELFYSHLQDADSLVRGPLVYTEASHKSPPQIVRDLTLFMMEVLLTDNKQTWSDRVIPYHIEPPVDKT